MQTYLDYAQENSRIIHTLMHECEGNIPQTVPSIMNQCCEQYLKHVVKEYIPTSTLLREYVNPKDKQAIRSGDIPQHVITNLYRFILKYVEGDWSLKNEIRDMKRYFFEAARYPEWGRDVIFSQSMIQESYKNFCKTEKEVMLFLKQKELEDLQTEYEDDFDLD